MRFAILLPAFLLACTADDGDDPADAASEDARVLVDRGTPAAWWTPSVDTTWTWQLKDTIDTRIDAMVYDIDLIDAPDAVLDALHAANRRVVCYFSAGSSENWRDDFDALPAAALGKLLPDYDDERWLDIRAAGVRDFMTARLDLAAERGCDGVEPDNVDGYANDSGFPLTAADQLAFNRWLADEAHARDLAVGLKNDSDQVADLVDAFDFAVVEQCVYYDECDAYASFPANGRPVFLAEYRDTRAQAEAARDAVCGAVGAGFHALILPIALDGTFRVACEP